MKWNRRGQIKRALYVSCLHGWITKSAFNEMLEDLNTVEPIKPGRWIKAGRNLWDCSECGQRIFSMSKQDREEFHKWCGRCGAKMEVK